LDFIRAFQHHTHAMSTRIHAVLILLAAFAMGECAQAARAEAVPETRAAFTAAMLRVRQNEPDQPDPLALRQYAIYDYLLAARLRRDLATQADETLDTKIDAFLEARTALPVGRALRREWLASLAQRARWDWFLARSADVSDPALICQRFAGRLATADTEGLAPVVLARWSLPQKQPPQCAAAFAWLRQQGLITPPLAVARARAALQADNPRLAREAAADVSAADATALLRWSDLLENPKSAVNVLATQPTLPIEADALAAGFDKLTRVDESAALSALPALLSRSEITPALALHLRRSAALAAAYARDPLAIPLFEAFVSEADDTGVQEWRVRAALWAGNYPKARAWIEQMPPALATQPRWRYWRARAVERTDGADAAAPLYAQAASLRDLYGYLAADHLHQPYQLNARELPDEMAIQNAMAAEPGMVRARELFRCDLADEAAVEWNLALSNASASLKVQAARLASRWGWYAQSIATLAQTGEFDDVTLRYPRPYAGEVQEAAKLAQISPDWILSVMRQESLFRKDALSRADARGLMQMLPGTATLIARRWHITPPSRDALFDPAVSIPLGAAYLHELLERYDGNLVLALAAYNAGPSAVARWIPASPMDADVWMENIPYNETRGYVQHILEHIVAFASVRGAPPPSMAALLKSVAAPASLL
jgi:soluble lytic murein transglycosylase